MLLNGLTAGIRLQPFGEVQLRDGLWGREPVRLLWADNVPDLLAGVLLFRLRQRAVLDVPNALALVRVGQEGKSHWLALEAVRAPQVRTWIRAVSYDPTLANEAVAVSMVRQVAVALQAMYETTEHLPGGYVDDVLLNIDGTIRLGSLGELAPDPRLKESAHVVRLVQWLRLLAGPTPSDALEDLLFGVAKGAKLRHLVRIIDAFLETCPQLKVGRKEWGQLVKQLQPIDDESSGH